MNIYFCGSIRGGREDQALYQEIINLLKTYGEVLTEHVADPNLTTHGEAYDPKMIFARDLELLKKADVVVAEVTTPSLGVGYEIAKAEALGKKVIALYRPSPDRSLSAMIAGNPHPYILKYARVSELKKVFDQALL